MHHQPTADKFSVDEWLKSIDVWDEKFDYVMHDDHWLTSKWSPDCEKCQAVQASQDLIDLNETFDLYRSAIAETPKVNHKHHRPRSPVNENHFQLQQQQQQQQGVTSKIPKIPVRLSRQF
jgi:UDP-N-acetylglucosamine pyrophosphorylase